MNINIKNGVINMAYKITDKCIACGACAAACPMQCIHKAEDGTKYEINERYDHIFVKSGKC